MPPHPPHPTHRTPLTRTPLLPLLLALLCLTLPAFPQVPPPTTPSHQPLPDLDLVLLWNGDRLTGTLRHDALRLRLPEGTLTLPLHQIHALHLADGRGSPDVLIAANHDRFSGLLLETSLRLTTSPDAPPREILPPKIRQLILHPRPPHPTPAAPSPQSVRIRLRRGDTFTATLPPHFLRHADSAQAVDLSSEPWTALSFPPLDGPPARLLRHSNSPLLVTITNDTLPCQLDLGPTLTLYRAWIEEILPAPPPATDPAPAPTPDPPPSLRTIPGMRWIAPGEFLMGSPADEAERDLDEGPQTRVIFPTGFWIGQYEVSQAEFVSLMGHNPSLYLDDPTRPVERVNWQEAMAYCEHLTQREQAAGHLPDTHAYRLPTEAEWEYAARAGTSTRFSFGHDPHATLIDRFAWYDKNSASTSHPVGAKEPNPWGLHDLHGNVMEWCLDAWQGSLPGGTITNLAHRSPATLRAARGGSWLYAPPFCRSANRDSYGPLNRCSDLGFRVVLAPHTP